MTPTEFLAWEREQPVRHHYVRGEVFDMAGGSPRHNALGAEVLSALAARLKGGPCRSFSADQKIGLADDVFVYADASVICGPIQLRPNTKDVALNPRVVVEVISKSTEAYDRGEKLFGYLALASVQHVLLVSQTHPQIAVYTRAADGTVRFELFGAGATVALVDLKLAFAIDDIYAGIFDLPGDVAEVASQR